jgi:hypothetical protein
MGDFQVLNKTYLISMGKLTTGGTAYFLTRPDSPKVRTDEYVRHAVEQLKEAGLHKE